MTRCISMWMSILLGSPPMKNIVFWQHPFVVINVMSICMQTCMHKSDVIMSSIASRITFASIVCSTVCSGAENIEAPRHWPVWGNPLVTGGFPSQRASNTENVSIWWRHHDAISCINKARWPYLCLSHTKRTILRATYNDLHNQVCEK